MVTAIFDSMQGFQSGFLYEPARWSEFSMEPWNKNLLDPFRSFSDPCIARHANVWLIAFADFCADLLMELWNERRPKLSGSVHL